MKSQFLEGNMQFRLLLMIFFSEPAIGWLISFSVGKNTACIVN